MAYTVHSTGISQIVELDTGTPLIRQVKIFRTKRITLVADAIAYADGERIGPAPISAECVRGAGLTWAL